jgi:integrase/recombinase XerD
MLKLFRYHLQDLKRLRTGPLSTHLDDFALLLEKRRYCEATAWRKLRLVARLSHWLATNQLQVARLSEHSIKSFLENPTKDRPHLSGDRSTITLLLRSLRENGIVPSSVPAAISSTQELVISQYKQFLLKERGLAADTVKCHLRVARRFLSHCFPDGKCHWGDLHMQNIHQFLLHDSSCRGSRSLPSRTCGLRSFLGFLFQQKHISTNLASTVPKVAGWRSPELPRYLGTAQVEKVLQSCDRRRKVGKRDYAILLLLARLGLRAGEVIHLMLDDINWLTGEVCIRGKGYRTDRLPLVQDVGQALVEYLRKGRPACSSRQVFIQSLAPYEPIQSSHTISALVQRAEARAKLPLPHRGAHVLRHALATRMVRGGASLAQIGQVLRHQHSETTVIYAKVDLTALRALAQPWIGGAR